MTFAALLSFSLNKAEVALKDRSHFSRLEYYSGLCSCILYSVCLLDMDNTLIVAVSESCAETEIFIFSIKDRAADIYINLGLLQRNKGQKPSPAKP